LHNHVNVEVKLVHPAQISNKFGFVHSWRTRSSKRLLIGVQVAELQIKQPNLT